MPELSAEDCGLIIAALEEYAKDHPFPADAARCAELAELVADHGLRADRTCSRPGRVSGTQENR